jgi:hypothetical protein
VANPSSSELLIGSVCGEYGSAYCTPKRFFDYMGNYDNTFSPFTLVFNLVDDSDTGAINHTALKCNEAYVSPLAFRRNNLTFSSRRMGQRRAVASTANSAVIRE